MKTDDDYDNGTGFARLIDDVEARFGATPAFGYAGGCVNMVLDVGELRVNVTDAEQCYLTHIDQRTDADGFTVGIYTRDGFDVDGIPVVSVTRLVGSDQLVDLIEEALEAHKALEAKASRAREAVAAYVALIGDDELSSTLTDLFTDLRHLCHLDGVDFGAAVERSRTHHDAELCGEF